jgi:catechol 2,3-dioxygenase-like lactoylglutathione lyase family enzyme
MNTRIHRLLQRTTLLTLAAILAAPLALAQTPAAPAPPFNGIAHIAIRVKDIAASVAFYNKLGFEEAFAMHAKDGSVSQSFIKINDKQFIELYPVSSSNPTQDKPEFLHLCFEGVDLNAIHDFYVAEGLTPIAVRTAGAGNLLFTMKGPMQFRDPQNIEYTQYMPGSLHSKDTGLHLGPNRIADKMVSVTLAMQDPAAARTYYVDKLGFKFSKEGKREFFGLPGTSGEAVEIVPVSSLGSKSSITLASPDIHHTGELLHTAGIDFTDADQITVTDPDGNLLHIIPAHK